MNDPITSSRQERRKHYHPYLLRLWRTGQAEHGCWHASLENSHTGERIGFAGLEELFAFLMERVDADLKGVSMKQARRNGCD